MKKWLTLLLCGTMMMTTFVGCGGEAPATEEPADKEPEKPTNPFVDVVNTDCWGERSVAVLGDSVSFGAGCSGSITDNSYVGIVRKAVNEANGSQNYGFVSAYPTNWGNPRSDEIHPWPTMTGGPGVVGNPSGWEENDNGDFLAKMALTAYDKGATVTYRLADGYDYAYACVYYRTGTDYGTFSVGTGEGTAFKALTSVNGESAYDGNNTASVVKRTDFFAVKDMTDGLTVCVDSDGKPVSVAGIGYYNDISGDMVTFNNYSRGGLMFSEVSDTVIDQAASAGTLILGVGYNDVYWGASNGYFEDDFTDRVNYLIEAVKKNGTKLIVNDYIWDNPKTTTNQLQKAMKEHCRAELQRLAEETGGVYINQSEIHGDAIIEALNDNDGVHPTDAGHQLMADAIIEAMGLNEGEA